MRLISFLILTFIVLSAGCSNNNVAQDKTPVVAPTGDVILAANQKSASVSLIEVKTGRTIAHLPVGDGPHEAAVSPDGRTAVVPLFGRSIRGDGYGKELAVIDIASGSVRRKIDLDKNISPHGAVFLADNRTAVIAASDSKTVVFVDTENGKITETVKIGNQPYLIASSPDGQFVYTTNPWNDTLSEINLASKKPARTFSIQGEPGGIAVARDGKSLWIARPGADALSVFDLERGEITKTFEGIDKLRRVSISPDGKTVLVTSAALNEVRIYDADTKQETGKIPLGEDIFASGIIFGLNSETAYATAPRSNLILELDVKNRRVLRKFATESSPDGIIYIRGATQNK
jgi:YVTN family beta-propeller protein